MESKAPSAIPTATTCCARQLLFRRSPVRRYWEFGQGYANLFLNSAVNFTLLRYALEQFLMLHAPALDRMPTRVLNLAPVRDHGSHDGFEQLAVVAVPQM